MQGITILGRADEFISHNHLMSGAAEPQEVEISPLTPILRMTKDCKDAYVSCNYAKIKELQNKAQEDLRPIIENIDKNEASAWVKVRRDGKEFYLSWSARGCVWAMETDSINVNTNANDEPKYSKTVTIGTYTQTAKSMGVQTCNLTSGTMIVQSVLSVVLATAFTKIIAKGLSFAFTSLAMKVTELADRFGVQRMAFVLPAKLISGIAFGIAALAFTFAIMYLWDWLNRKYTITMQVFNWDPDNEWSLSKETRSNAEFPGLEKNHKAEFTLSKMLLPGQTIVPPGFMPVESLDYCCTYAEMVWSNERTFAEGLSAAIQMKKGKTDEGFVWAFDCPRFSDNKHGAENGLKDPATFLAEKRWNKTPFSYSIKSTSANIPVTFSTDTLSGASDYTYKFMIHINK